MHKYIKRLLMVAGALLIPLVVLLSAFYAKEILEEPNSTTANTYPSSDGFALQEGNMLSQGSGWSLEVSGKSLPVTFLNDALVLKLPLQESSISVVALAKKEGMAWLVKDISIIDSDQPSSTIQQQTFVIDYFAAIESRSFSELKSDFWTEDVPLQIASQCGNPIDSIVAGDLKTLWNQCAGLEEVSVKIMSINKHSQGWEVFVQITDENDDIIAIDLRPELSNGHRLLLIQTKEGIRTQDWKFF